MRYLLKITLSLALGVFCFKAANAQADFSHPKFAVWGDSVSEREENYKNYAFFGDDITLKNWAGAAERLGQLVVKSPRGSENIYIRGINVYKNLYNEAATPAEKEALVDKIMNLYDLRNEYFGGEKSGLILTNKAYDMMRYRPTDIDAQRKVVSDAFKASGDSVDLNLALGYFNNVVNDYVRNTDVDPEQILNDFDMVNAAISKSSNMEDREKYLANVDELLLQSGAANCGNLEKMFRPKFRANPNDLDLIRKTLSYFGRNECNSAFVTELSEKYYTLSPSPESAFALAVVFVGEGDDAKAQRYFREAMKLDTSHEKMPAYFSTYAVYELSKGRASQAADLSKQLISIQPNNYLGYKYLGQAYATGASRSGCDDLNRKMVYYLVVDNLQKARDRATDVSEQQSLSNMIRTYSSYFPTKEDIFFMEGAQVGSGITVNCGWISGYTTVRTSN